MIGISRRAVKATPDAGGAALDCDGEGLGVALRKSPGELRTR